MSAALNDLLAMLAFEAEARRDDDPWGIWAIRTVEEHFLGRPLE